MFVDFRLQSQLFQSVRTIGNDSRRAGVLGGVFVLLAMFGSYTRIRFFASVVLRLVLFLGGLYAFTLLPLYHHFPEFRERYSVSVLVRKFVSLVNPSSYRFGASSSTVCYSKFLFFCFFFF